MNPVLIYLRPLDRRTNTRVDVRVGDAPSADAYGTGSVEWAPGIVARPSMSIELMSPDMDGRVQAGQARFTISLNRVTAVENPETLYWRGASVVIHNTGVLEGDTAIPDFWGNVTSENVSLDGRTVQITAEVSVAFLDKPLLTGSFTGGGGLAGDPDKRGVLFPAGFGAQQNIPPVWFDQTNNIGMIDGYGNCTAISWAGEGLSSLGPAVGNYADYAALLAAVQNKTIPPGRWGISVQPNKPALIALGAPPVGVITVHATFGANRTGAMIRRILLTHAKLPTARVDDASLTALDAAVDRAVHYWTSEQRQVKDLLEALAQGANATPIVTFQNQVAVTRAVLGTPVATLDRSGAQEPRVLDWRATSSEPPFYKMTARGARPALVLSLDQVNYVDTLVDRGLYKNDVVYRRGNLVTTTDEAQWVYTNEIADKGHAPPYVNGVYQSSDAYWTNIKPPASYTGTPLYNDGTPIDALRPADNGATRGAPAGTSVGGVEANQLVARANTAQADAAAANAALAIIASDNQLDVGEKSAVIARYNEIVAEQQPLVDQANALGVDRTDLQGKQNALANYLGGLSQNGQYPAWNSFTGPTPIDGPTFRQKFADYYDARVKLLMAMSAKVQANAQAAADKATAAAAQATTAQASIAQIVDNNVLDAGEKPEAVKEVKRIRDEYQDNIQTAASYPNQIDTGSYTAVYNALIAYFDGLTPAATSYTTNTPIVRADYSKYFTDYYIIRQYVLNDIAYAASLWGNVTGAMKPDDGATLGMNMIRSWDKLLRTTYVGGAYKDGGAAGTGSGPNLRDRHRVVFPTNGGNLVAAYFEPVVGALAVTPGDRLFAAFDGNFQNGTFRYVIRFFNSSGSDLGAIFADVQSNGTNAWRTLGGIVFDVPDPAASVQVYLQWYNGSGVAYGAMPVLQRVAPGADATAAAIAGGAADSKIQSYTTPIANRTTTVEGKTAVVEQKTVKLGTNGRALSARLASIYGNRGAQLVCIPTNGNTNVGGTVVAGVPGSPIWAYVSPGTGGQQSTIQVLSHKIVDDEGQVEFGGAIYYGLAMSTLYWCYEDGAGYSGGNPTYQFTTNAEVLNSPNRRLIGSVLTPPAGAPDASGYSGGGGGGGGIRERYYANQRTAATYEP